MQKKLITLGILIIIIGLVWPIMHKIPLGRLPGDIIINKPSFKLYIPFTTMILISVAASIILWLLKK